MEYRPSKPDVTGSSPVGRATSGNHLIPHSLKKHKFTKEN